MTAAAAAPHGEPPVPWTAPTAGSVQRVLVLADARKPAVEGALPRVRAWLGERVRAVEVVGDAREFARQRARTTTPGTGGEHPDLVVVLGGDGSILAAVRAFQEDPVPTVGINFGRVGFLAAIAAPHWTEGLADVLEGRGIVEPRMRLEARVHMRTSSAPTHVVALNELVVSRGVLQGMVTVTLEVAGRWVSDYRADGLIVASPSGSTAHSLAAGGPLLAPSMNAFVVTPISAHALSHRPLVLHPDNPLTMRVAKSSGIVTLSVDGREFHALESDDWVEIRRHPVPYPLLSDASGDPWLRLRERLGWRGSFEPDPDVDGHRDDSDRPAAGQGEIL